MKMFSLPPIGIFLAVTFLWGCSTVNEYRQKQRDTKILENLETYVQSLTLPHPGWSYSGVEVIDDPHKIQELIGHQLSERLFSIEFLIQQDQSTPKSIWSLRKQYFQQVCPKEIQFYKPFRQNELLTLLIFFEEKEGALTRFPWKLVECNSNAIQAVNYDQVWKEVVDLAEKTIRMSQSSQTLKQWNQITQHWQDIETALEQIPDTHSKYQQAQDKQIEYQAYFKEAKRNRQKLYDENFGFCNGAKSTQKSEPVFISQTRWYQAAPETFDFEIYLVGCLTNNSQQTLQSGFILVGNLGIVDVSLPLEELLPGQTTPFRIKPKMSVNAPNLVIESIVASNYTDDQYWFRPPLSVNPSPLNSTRSENTFCEDVSPSFLNTIEVNKLNFYQVPSDIFSFSLHPEKSLIIGCLTNNSDRNIDSITLLYKIESGEFVGAGGSTNIRFYGDTIAPRQTVPFWYSESLHHDTVVKISTEVGAVEQKIKVNP